MSRSSDSYHHGDLGRALEDSALELLRTEGHASLSLREVARTAGVSHNAPYHHFATRAMLLKRLSERSMGELLAQLEHAREDGGTPATAGARAVRIGLAYVAYAAEYPERFRLIYDPEVCIPGSPTPEMEPLLAAVGHLLEETVRGIRPTATPDELAASTTGVWGAVHGLAELVIAGHISTTGAEPALMALFVPPGLV